MSGKRQLFRTNMYVVLDIRRKKTKKNIPLANQKIEKLIHDLPDILIIIYIVLNFFSVRKKGERDSNVFLKRRVRDANYSKQRTVNQL